MAGIYLHIPFCKKACHYCDFHFSTLIAGKEDLLKAMHTELKLRRNDLSGEKVETIYFGGGSPSILDADEISRLLDTITQLYEVDASAEITLEANPDDIRPEKVRSWIHSGLNRLSIGIQSFRDQDLVFMNRAHDASQADASVKIAQDAGINNITIDLMYSIPGMSDDDWKRNLEKAVSLEVPHISSYSLTIEPGTVFGVYEKRGKLRAMEQEASASQFLILSDFLRHAGFDHYEVSNFARPGFYSRHNTSYWQNKKYIGIGPSAHSYSGERREWNVSNNPIYTRTLLEGKLACEGEDITRSARINEYIMTGLRTKWGVDLDYMKDQLEFDLMREHGAQIEEEISEKRMLHEGRILRLTTEGMLMADRIASDFFTLNNES